jgi:hypothetical protein
VARDDLAALERRRERACRLDARYALRDLDEAEAWVKERGVVTIALTNELYLPSLFVACHEEPYEAGKGGFARWPKTRWWWPGELAGREGIVELKILRGRTVLLSEPVARLVAPLARGSLAAAQAGTHGESARRVVEHLASAGPTLVEELREELALPAAELRRVRAALERTAAVVSRGARVPTKQGGHRHTSELLRWDQLFAEESSGGIDDLVLAAVRSAVVAPERQVARWFTWPEDVDALAAAGRLARVDGYVTIPASGS